MAKTANFWYNFAKKGYTPLSDFYQIWLGEGVPVLLPPAKFHRCGLKNMGLQPPKSPKLVFFGINLPKSGIPPYAIFLQNLTWGRESQVRIVRYASVTQMCCRYPLSVTSGSMFTLTSFAVKIFRIDLGTLHHIFLRKVRYLLRFKNSDNLICSLFLDNASSEINYSARSIRQM